MSLDDVNDHNNLGSRAAALAATVQDTVLGDPAMGQHLHALSNVLFAVHMHYQDSTALDLSIRFASAAVDCTPAADAPAVAARHHRLAEAHGFRHRFAHSCPDLSHALSNAVIAVRFTPLGHPDLPHRMFTLSVAYEERHQLLGAPSDCDLALLYKRAVLSALPAGHVQIPHAQQGLGAGLIERYKLRGAEGDLETARQLFHAATDATPVESPAYLDRLQCLSVAYLERFKRYGDLDDLEKTLRFDHEVLDKTPLGDYRLPERLHGLSASYTYKYRRLGHLDDLEKSTEYARAALAGTPPTHPSFPDRKESLALSLLDRFQRLNELGDLDAALENAQAAIDHTLGSNVLLAKRQCVLSSIYTQKYQSFGAVEDLEKVIKLDKEILDHTPAGHPDLALRRLNLSLAYGLRFQRFGDLADLQRGLDLDLLNIKSISADHPEVSDIQANLATSYFSRYKRLGDADDLANAIKCSKLALEILPIDHSDNAQRQQYLAMLYMYRYKRWNALNDLLLGFEYISKAVQNTPLGHSNLPSRHSDLAAGYVTRFQANQNLDDLQEAFKYYKLAIDNVSPDYSGLPNWLHNFSTAYNIRYSRLGDYNDLVLSIKYGQDAISHLPENHPDLPEMQSALSGSYMNKFKKFEDLKDLEIALAYQQAVLNSTPDDHADLADRQEGLAMIYGIRYQNLGNLEDFKTAVDFLERAIQNTPSEHADLPGLWQGLGIVYIDHHLKLKDKESLDKAMSYFTLAIEKSIQKNNSSFATRQEHLAAVYFIRSLAESNESDYDTGYALLKQSASVQFSSPFVRWHIAIRMSSYVSKLKSLDDIEIYTKAFSALPELLWMGNSMSTRHESIRNLNISGIAASAAAAALQFNNIAKAMEFLEASLAITHRQSAELHISFSNLEAVLPDDAKELKFFSSQLVMAYDKTDNSDDIHDVTVKRNQILARIRQNPQFADFLQAPTWAYLSKAAAEGPIVVLTCRNEEAHAIIILPDVEGSCFIKLEDVSAEKLDSVSQQLKHGLSFYSIASRDLDISRHVKRGDVSSDTILRCVISWLGRFVVKPVFDVLKKSGIEHGRLWWCPSGAFTYLPIHAAAPVESRFVQSYTFTLESLVKSRDQHAESKPITTTTGQPSETILAVGLSDVSRSRLPKLPSVLKEIECIAREFETSSHKLVQLLNAEATLANVLECLASSQWLHFACHGQQVAADALGSGLELYDGRLTLGQLASVDMSGAKFVFLSACETATGDVSLTNEAMHLAGAFVAHGVRGAIGTLWSIPDAYGPRVAEGVYRTVFGEGGPDVKLAAEGLHESIKRLRKEGAPLHQWMPFIHIGI